MPGFLHCGVWDRGHDCGAAPTLGLPFLLVHVLSSVPPTVFSVMPTGTAASAGCILSSSSSAGWPASSQSSTPGPPVIRHWRANEGIESLNTFQAHRDSARLRSQVVFLYSSRGASWTKAGRWIPAGDNGYPDGLPVLPSVRGA